MYISLQFDSVTNMAVILSELFGGNEKCVYYLPE